MKSTEERDVSANFITFLREWKATSDQSNEYALHFCIVLYRIDVDKLFGVDRVDNCNDQQWAREKKTENVERRRGAFCIFFPLKAFFSLCRVYVSEMTTTYSWSTSDLKRVHRSITTAISRYRGPQRNLRPCAVPFRRNRKCNAGPNYCRHQISLGIGHRASSCRSIFSYWFYCSPFAVLDVAIYRLDEPAGGGYARVMVVSF